MKVLCVMLVFLVVSLVVGDVIQVQLITRHCDRTTAWADYFHLDNFKETTDITEILDLAVGDLTPLGQLQCYTLGEHIRERYLKKESENFIRDINPQYNVMDYQFTASPIKRTIISGYSASLALFPNKEGKTIDYGPYKGQYPYPGGEQGIPYQGTIWDNCPFVAHMLCPKIMKNYAPDSEYMVNWYKSIKVDADEILTVTGNIAENAELFYHLTDLVFVLKFHGRLPTEVDALWDKIHARAMDVYNKMYNRRTLGNLGGGLMAEMFVKNIQTFLENENGIVEPSAKKFIHYSAHDQSLTSLAAALDVQDSYTCLYGLPLYGSAFIFELHEEQTKYYVNILYKDGFNGSYVPIKLKGCTQFCELSRFYEIMNETAIPRNWCSECKSGDIPPTNECYKQYYLSGHWMLWLRDMIDLVAYATLVTICVMLAIACVIMCFIVNRKRQGEYSPVNTPYSIH